jgi:hypothetical protein
VRRRCAVLSVKDSPSRTPGEVTDGRQTTSAVQGGRKHKSDCLRDESFRSIDASVLAGAWMLVLSEKQVLLGV